MVLGDELIFCLCQRKRFREMSEQWLCLPVAINLGNLGDLGDLGDLGNVGTEFRPKISLKGIYSNPE